MGANPSLGAAITYTQTQLGGPCQDQDSNPTVGTTPIQIVNGNGDRVGLLIINLSAQTVFIALTPSVGATSGIQLLANGGNFSVNVRDDFTLPSRAWYGVATGAGAQLYILEVIRFRMTP